MTDDELATRYRESVLGEPPPRTDKELAYSLAGAVAWAKSVKNPTMQRAALDGMTQLCGLVIALRRRVERLEYVVVKVGLALQIVNVRSKRGGEARHAGCPWRVVD